MRENKRVSDFAILASIVVAWIAIDRITKVLVDSYQANTVIFGPILGIFDITLVHNTGAAWGIFGDSTILLGIFSVVVCALAILYIALVKPPASTLSTIGISLIVAGGIGNAIDRFSNQYVIDFIRPIFIDFPVFNIADIGVTVGVIVFIISLLLDFRNTDPGDIDE